MLAVSIGQAIYVALFARAMNMASTCEILNEPNLPAAAIILCVRGNDPTLQNCLTAIANLDYPEFDLHIMVDHESDSAMPVVRQFADQNNAHIHVLSDPLKTCSLKCNSLIQAFDRVGSKAQILAFLDADTVPHPQWLKCLASHLAVEGMGLVSGIRCFTPSASNAGSLIRHQWNSAATVQMFLYRIPWGGTLAMHSSLVEKLELKTKWSRAFCEDTMMADLLTKHNLKVCIALSLVLPNHESCQIADFINWVSRQLLTTKLYHSAWPLIIAHATITTFAWLAPVITLIVAMALGNSTSALWSIATLCGFQIANWLMLVSNQSCVQNQLAKTGASKDWLTLKKKLKLFALMPVTQCVYFIAVVKTISTRTVSWRKIDYQINGPFEIERLNYIAYSKSNEGSQSL